MRKRLPMLVGLLFLLANTVFAQTVEVSGRVTDTKGDPLAGVSISEKGTLNGASTGANGIFKITVKTNAILIFSSVGFAAKEMTVSGSTLNVSLEGTVVQISEVVVTSMGIKREKKALGYAVSTIDKGKIEMRPDGDVIRILNGKVPGVDIGATSGISGSGTNILIRGLSTINGGWCSL
jgi:outer membrane receptor protein involved in Fe transport